MPELRSVREVSCWLSMPSAGTFPYDGVLEDFLRVGKHFAPEELLDLLQQTRQRLPGISGAACVRGQLAAFLDVALDKRDKCYDYISYLALPLLPLPGTDPHGTPGTAATSVQLKHDRLFMHLIADTIRFELDVLDGRCQQLPQLRPAARTAVKRLRLAARIVRPPMHRLGLADAASEPGAGTEPHTLAVAVGLAAAADVDLDADDRRMLRLTMLPVWTAHDEYMFIRVLQAFETTFALLAVRIRVAVTALADRAPELAVTAIGEAEESLRETALAFSLLATMQVTSFLTFRQYTEGASAIQSRNYKIVESLCAPPERSRLDSAAYESVPEVREKLISGQPNLQDLLRAARSSWLLPAVYADLETAMLRFESALLQWRRTHYRLAVRMLGERPGSGYTAGTPYLKSAQSIRVFSLS